MLTTLICISVAAYLATLARRFHRPAACNPNPSAAVSSIASPRSNPNWRKEFEDKLRKGVLTVAPKPLSPFAERMRRHALSALDAVARKAESRPPPPLALADMERHAGIVETNLPGLPKRGYSEAELAAAWHQAREAIDRAAR